MQYTYRPYEDARDFDALVALNAALRTGRTAEALQQWYAWRVSNEFAFDFYTIEHSGTVVGFFQLHQDWWRFHPEKVFFTVYLLPAHDTPDIRTQVLDFAKKEARTHHRIALLDIAFDDHPDAMTWLESNGFESTFTEIYSRLMVADVDVAAYAVLRATLKAAGVTYVHAQEMQHIPRHLLQQLRDLQADIYEDIPTPDPPVPPTLASVATDIANVEEGHYLFAADTDGKPVGIVKLVIEGDYCEFALTGVARDFRRKGLATAMKIYLIELLQRDSPILSIITANAPQNPMYDINLKMGFRAYKTRHTFELRL